MHELMVPAITLICMHGTAATYVIEPLTPGYGWTVGSTLHRALLSSLPGQAIVGLRIAGWTTGDERLPGIKETVSELVLNCKQVRVRDLDGERCSYNLYLEATGRGSITACSLMAPEGVEVVTPEVHLATLISEEATLSMEMLVRVGKGYVPTNAQEEPAPGVIPVDAIYSPVRAVNYAVEKTRVGPMVNYERIELEISTDGTISPDDALRMSAAYLQRHYTLFATFDAKRVSMEPVPPDAIPIPPQIATMRLENLGLPARTYNSLKRRSLTTVGQVLSMTEEELRGIRNFGEQALYHVQERLLALKLLPDTPRISPETDVKSDYDQVLHIERLPHQFP